MWTAAIAWTVLMWMVIGSMVLTVAVRSIAVATLWQWFAVPTFGLPPLGYAAAAGLMLIAMVFQVGALSPDAVMRVSEKAEEESETRPFRTLMFKLALDTVFVPLSLIAVGWLIKGAM